MRELKPFREVDRKDWFVAGNKNRPDRIAAWHNGDFTVQVFAVADGVIRLAINQARMIPSERLFSDGIDWSTIHAIKAAVGFEAWTGVEIYPPQAHILNAVNARHLWLLPESKPPLPANAMDDGTFVRQHRTAEFGVDQYKVPGDITLLAVWRTNEKSAHGIPWETLQRIKDAIGFADQSAFEVSAVGEQPASLEYRCLWLLPQRFAFEWDICPQTGKVLNTNWDK